MDFHEQDVLVSSVFTQRRRQDSRTQRLVRRKQVSLDMFSPTEIDFFAGTPPPVPEDDEDEEVVVLSEDVEEEDTGTLSTKDLFYPLRFLPREVSRRRIDTNDKSGDEEMKIEEENEVDDAPEDATKILHQAPYKNQIIRLTKHDKVKTAILFCIMTAFLGVCVGWKTHSNEAHSLFGSVGLACVTPCYGDPTYRDFFIGQHDSFRQGDVRYQSWTLSFITLIIVLNY